MRDRTIGEMPQYHLIRKSNESLADNRKKERSVTDVIVAYRNDDAPLTKHATDAYIIYT